MDKSPNAFRTISEVAELLETPAHVLRFWESRFPQIRPVKRAGGRRYYRPADLALLTGIKHLLHDEGMTIRGVQKILREQGVRHVSGMSDDATPEEDDAAVEAALAASGGAQDDTPALPPAEAETAQIIALQTALSQPPAPPRKASPPLDAGDLFTRLTPEPSESAASAVPSQPLVEDPPTQDVPAETAAEIAAEIVADVPEVAADEARPIDEAEPITAPEDEAPMTEWAEAEAAPETALPPGPALKITRIGGATLTASNPDAAATIGRRLRATRRDGLSASDRATLSILRAKARSLRDRLGA